MSDKREVGTESAVAELLERNRQLAGEAARQQQANDMLQQRIEALAGRLSATDEVDLADEVCDSETLERQADLPSELRVRRRPDPLSRRRLLALGGVGVVGGAVVASVLNETVAAASPSVAAHVTAPASGPSNPGASGIGQIIVPAPTGVAITDMGNILEALINSTPGTQVVLQWTSDYAYAVDQEIPIPPGVRLTGFGANNEITAAGPPHAPGGAMPSLEQVAGASLLCTVASQGYLAGLYGPSNPGKYPAYNALYNNGTANPVGDSGIEIDHVAFNGQNGGGVAGNTNGHGIVLFSSGSSVHDCFLFNTPQVSIVVSDVNYAGTAATGAVWGNRIVDSTVYNCGQQAVLVVNTPGSPGCHDGYLLNNNIEATSKGVASLTDQLNINPTTGIPYEAVRMENSAGWFVVNNHPYQVPGNGWYVSNAWGLHFVDNSTDDFGSYPSDGHTYLGYDFYLSAPTESTPPPLLPSLISGNQVSGYEGFNTNDHDGGVGNRAANASNRFLYFRITMQQVSQTNPTPGASVVHSNNSAHQNSQPASPIIGATVASGSSTVTFPVTVSSLLQQGMSVSDSLGYIPSGSYIGSVGTDTITLVNAHGSAVNATGSSHTDTVSFPGPTSVGWTYVNDVAGSTLTIDRTNELISPTVSATPVTAGTGSVTVKDPVNYAGGLAVTGTPTAGQTIVATSTTAAQWGAPPAGVLTGPAGGVLGGDYPNPTFASGLTTVLSASGTYDIPTAASVLRITCVGGGGGGGGGGAALVNMAQVGGAGGAAGVTSVQVVPVSTNTQLVVHVGTPGTGGVGAKGGGDTAGGAGGGGGPSSVTGSGISVRGGGGGGGQAGQGASTTAVHGAAYGAPGNVYTATASGGSGGSSGLDGGFPVSLSTGGGGGGGTGGSSLGGGGGSAGSPSGLASAGKTGGNSSTSGGTGASATAMGGPGGGGGGGVLGGAGGAGGAGAPGYVIIEVVG